MRNQFKEKFWSLRNTIGVALVLTTFFAVVTITLDVINTQAGFTISTANWFLNVFIIWNIVFRIEPLLRRITITLDAKRENEP
jgi:hypothetical protein